MRPIIQSLCGLASEGQSGSLPLKATLSVRWKYWKRRDFYASYQHVEQKTIHLYGNFSQGGGTPGTKRGIAFSQLAVKGLIN
jgi:hypothetical protein